MNQIVINYIVGGTFPVQVFIADIYGNNKTLIGTVSGAVPPQVTFDVTIPPIFETADEVMLILEDTNGCQIFKILPCSAQLLQVCLIFQDGTEFGTQGIPPSFIPQQVCAQQNASSYEVNLGDSVEIFSCSNNNFVTTLFSAVDGWESIISVYYDPGMDSPFDGNNLWYKTNSSNILLQINSEGYVINKFTCS